MKGRQGSSSQRAKRRAREATLIGNPPPPVDNAMCSCPSPKRPRACAPLLLFQAPASLAAGTHLDRTSYSARRACRPRAQVRSLKSCTLHAVQSVLGRPLPTAHCPLPTTRLLRASHVHVHAHVRVHVHVHPCRLISAQRRVAIMVHLSC